MGQLDDTTHDIYRRDDTSPELKGPRPLMDKHAQPVYRASPHSTGLLQQLGRQRLVDDIDNNHGIMQTRTITKR